MLFYFILFDWFIHLCVYVYMYIKFIMRFGLLIFVWDFYIYFLWRDRLAIFLFSNVLVRFYYQGYAGLIKWRFFLLFLSSIFFELHLIFSHNFLRCKHLFSPFFVIYINIITFSLSTILAVSYRFYYTFYFQHKQFPDFYFISSG